MWAVLALCFDWSGYLLTCSFHFFSGCALADSKSVISMERCPFHASYYSVCLSSPCVLLVHASDPMRLIPYVLFCLILSVLSRASYPCISFRPSYSMHHIPCVSFHAFCAKHPIPCCTPSYSVCLPCSCHLS